MIKRLKWNVLYGENAEDDSDLSDGSDDSTERESAGAQAVLDKLVRNDPTFASMLRMRVETSSVDEDDEDEERSNDEIIVDGSAPKPGKETSDNLNKVEYAEWRECQLCKGKRFLNDAEVEVHLASRRHAQAVRRAEKLSTTERNREVPVSSNSIADNGETASVGVQSPSQNSDLKIEIIPGKEHEEVHFRGNLDVRGPASLSENQTKEVGKNGPHPARKITEEQSRKAEKRKAAVKRKLKALKRRKWEKQKKMEKTKQLVPDGKEVQKHEARGEGEEQKQNMGLGSREQMKKKGTNRKRQRDTECSAGSGRDSLNGEDDPTRRKKTLKLKKKAMLIEAIGMPSIDDEPQGERSKRRKAGKDVKTWHKTDTKGQKR